MRNILHHLALHSRTFHLAGTFHVMARAGRTFCCGLQKIWHGCSAGCGLQPVLPSRAAAFPHSSFVGTFWPKNGRLLYRRLASSFGCTGMRNGCTVNVTTSHTTLLTPKKHSTTGQLMKAPMFFGFQVAFLPCCVLFDFSIADFVFGTWEGLRWIRVMIRTTTSFGRIFG